MALCHKLGKFGFEVIPQHLPYGQMSEVERHLWARLYESIEATQEKP